MGDTLVFIPAWNEESNVGAVIEEAARELPGADVLVIDDGSSDRTAEVARERGADVVSFPVNRGLAVAIAAGFEQAARRGYAFCGRLDADGQHPARELRRLLDLVRGGRCDVAVGSRFASGEGYPPYRYRSSGARSFGTALLRRALPLRTGRSFLDPTSGLYAVNARALPFLSEPFRTGAPEVEALMRLARAGLVVEELPVDMRERASGESKLAGRKALGLVLTVIATLVLFRRARR